MTLPSRMVLSSRMALPFEDGVPPSRMASTHRGWFLLIEDGSHLIEDAVLLI